MQRYRRRAISKMMLGLIVVAVLALGAAAYFLSTPAKPGVSAKVEVDISIIEDDPVLQIQHFYPSNFTVKDGQNVTLAIFNGDDEPRTFTMKDFNVNVTMGPGTAARVTFQANKVGTFVYFSPPSVPSPVSQGRPGKYIQGNMMVSP